jgi:hypothetical protein
MGFRGPPHPTRLYEPYHELKDASRPFIRRTLRSDRVLRERSTSGRRTVPDTPRRLHSDGVLRPGRRRFAGGAARDRDLDPNHKDIAGQVTGFFTGLSNRDVHPQRPSSDQASNVPALPRPEQEEPELGEHKTVESDRPKAEIAGRYDRGEVMKVSGGRELPSNGELSAFRGALTPDSLCELKIGLEGEGAGNRWTGVLRREVWIRNSRRLEGSGRNTEGCTTGVTENRGNAIL